MFIHLQPERNLQSHSKADSHFQSNIQVKKNDPILLGIETNFTSTELRLDHYCRASFSLKGKPIKLIKLTC